MNLLKSLMFSLVILISVSAYGASQEVQVDILMSKIVTLLKANKSAEALSFFAQLEAMEPTLSKPLPEKFQFFYIDTLDKAGNGAKALERANVYLEKYGNKGTQYGQVIDIYSRLQMQADNEAKALKEAEDKAKLQAEIRAEKYNRELLEYQRKLAEYEESKLKYENESFDLSKRYNKCNSDIMRDAAECYNNANKKESGLFGDYKAGARIRAYCAETYPENFCENRYDRLQNALHLPVAPIPPSQ